MNRTRAGLVAVLLTASMGLTACGGSGNDKASDNASPGSSSSSSSTVSNASYTPLTKDTWAKTVANSSSQTSHIVMKMGSMLTGSGDVSTSNGTPAMKMTMKITTGGKTINMEERLVDGTIYISAPGMIPGGKWMKVDSKTPGLGDMASMLKNFDPSSMAAMGKDAITTFKYVGADTIDGDSVHHYKLVVDTTKAVKKLGMGSLVSQAGSSVPKSITEEVYLNADNTVRRITGTIEGQNLQVDRTPLSGSVDVKAPPAGDVVDMSSMMSQLGSQSSAG